MPILPELHWDFYSLCLFWTCLMTSITLYVLFQIIATGQAKIIDLGGFLGAMTGLNLLPVIALFTGFMDREPFCCWFWFFWTVGFCTIGYGLLAMLAGSVAAVSIAYITFGEECLSRRIRI